MGNMNQYMPVRLFTGTGCVSKNKKEFAALGSRALIVTGKHSAKACGALDDVTAALSDQGMTWELYDRITQNPQLTDCMRAAEVAVGAGCDCIIGIGGGSPLDAAKCIAVLAANPGMTQQTLYSLDWPNRPWPVAAVGTTAGTGSEVTKVSVITVPGGRKKSFHHPDIFPLVSFGDPDYTKSASREVTLSTGIDALSHATESYFSRNANEISQCYAVEAVRLLMPVLSAMAGKSDDEDLSLGAWEREALYHGSIYGGLAINITGTCLPHAMGYLLTEQHNIPHGNACAVFLPAFLKINEEVMPDLTEGFFGRIGYGMSGYLRVVNALLRNVHVKVNEEEIAREHSRWIGNGSIAKGWGDITADQCDRILREISD